MPGTLRVPGTSVSPRQRDAIGGHGAGGVWITKSRSAAKSHEARPDTSCFAFFVHLRASAIQTLLRRRDAYVHSVCGSGRPRMALHECSNSPHGISYISGSFVDGPLHLRCHDRDAISPHAAPLSAHDKWQVGALGQVKPEPDLAAVCAVGGADIQAIVVDGHRVAQYGPTLLLSPKPPALTRSQFAPSAVRQTSMPVVEL